MGTEEIVWTRFDLGYEDFVEAWPSESGDEHPTILGKYAVTLGK